MFRPSVILQNVYLCLEPQDFRKGIRGLAQVVLHTLLLDPMSGHIAQ